MNALTDNELDSLIDEAELAALDEPTAEPRVQTPPKRDLSFFGKIPVQVTLEVAYTEIPLRDLMEVDGNSVIMLDKQAGEPLDVKVNGTLFAKAEVVVMNGNYGLRIVQFCGNRLNDLTT